MHRRVAMRTSWTLSLACLLALACGSQSQEAKYVGTTSRLVFGVDEEGRVVWKQAIPGAWVSTAFDSLYLAAEHEPARLTCGDLRTGEILWRYAGEGRLTLFTSERYSAGRPVVYCAFTLPREMVYVYLDARTGRVVKRWSRPTEPIPSRRPKGWVCPAKPTREVNLVTTARYLCAFDSVANRMWRAPLFPGEVGWPFGSKFAVVRGDSSVRILDRLTGQVLWARSFPARVLGVTGDDEHLQVSLADGTFRLYRPSTGRPFRPRRTAARR